MRNRLLALLLVLLGVHSVAGCTTESQGQPGPAYTASSEADIPDSTSPSGTAAPDGELPTDGAPPVDNPLDTSEFQRNPCRALTPTQSQELNVGTAGELFDGGLGNGCKWRNADTRGEAELVFLDKDPRGLSASYRANSDGKYAYFEELSLIEGYPAIARDVVDDRAKGHCTIVIGVSDEVAFEMILQLSQANIGKKDSCKLAVDVAGMALQTMLQGA